MKRRLITAILAATLAAVPLMGAKSCGTQAPSQGQVQIVPKGIELHRGGLVYWVGPVPPRPKAGTYWSPRGTTRKGNMIWLRQGTYHTNGKARP